MHSLCHFTWLFKHMHEIPFQCNRVCLENVTAVSPAVSQAQIVREEAQLHFNCCFISIYDQYHILWHYMYKSSYSFTVPVHHLWYILSFTRIENMKSLQNFLHIFTLKQQIHCIYTHNLIQMYHMDIYNWPDILYCVNKTEKCLTLLFVYRITLTVWVLISKVNITCLQLCGIHWIL